MKILKNLKKLICNNNSFFENRIFWSCYLHLAEDGWYYYVWENWFLEHYEGIFAGYNYKALNTKRSSFYTLKERLKNDKSRNSRT